ncbi:DUF853 family protein [Paenisporosarcina cavernae]|uniref:DUF853 family protein n=2 Tax=Paenisporosarcina cavernae TaxID=2320858 RepID=A0A385YVX3_9BACL|nr:DUF853 family protein [Paenisporosarcina cavernae]
MYVLGKSEQEVGVLSSMMNRHGLIAGATGTGKTITLKVMAERLSENGIPVFLADIKGDLGSLAQPGMMSDKLQSRLDEMGITNHSFRSFPVEFWDVFGEEGIPLRTTVSEIGPVLMARLLSLNETQTGILQIVFKVADDEGLLLLDLKDLRGALQLVGEKAKELRLEYGNISSASIGAIQRGLLQLEEQGGDVFFGEPAISIHDLINTTSEGEGIIHILSAKRLFSSPILYSTFLLWLLSELFEELQETGDLEKPKMVFFFDEAHLIIEESSKSLRDQLEQVVRLIRSKGIGIYFVTQNPTDLPDEILAQLGNRVQHSLRAFTPKDQKAIKQTAETFRKNPRLNVEEELTNLGVGEALVSFLDEKGRPLEVQKAMIYAPKSLIGVVDEGVKKSTIENSSLRPKYAQSIDRDSAYETLAKRIPEPEVLSEKKHTPKVPPKKKTELEKAAGSLLQTVGRQIGRELVRGIFGALKKR